MPLFLAYLLHILYPSLSILQHLLITQVQLSRFILSIKLITIRPYTLQSSLYSVKIYSINSISKIGDPYSTLAQIISSLVTLLLKSRHAILLVRQLLIYYTTQPRNPFSQSIQSSYVQSTILKAPLRSSYNSKALVLLLYIIYTISIIILTTNLVNYSYLLPIQPLGRRCCTSTVSVIQLAIIALNTFPIQLSSVISYQLLAYYSQFIIFPSLQSTIIFTMWKL